MAADMTDETIAEYMERIEKMSIKEIQKEIEFLESPGYNCEGLVCADGVITPRTKMHRKVLWYKRMNQKSLTALQWAKEGYTGEWEFYVESPYNKYRGKLEINV
ncbi:MULTISPECIES: hypothetical protein [Bacteroidaceae]|uniref:hypothetical protein n=1 Tax=Bacteroidaceae TaxID=815 RepID=UPI001F3EA174|nr:MULTISPECIES: hypothetical protein [Bacteroidaceae]